MDRLLAPKFDFVVDAIDNMTNKARLIAGCRDRLLRCLTLGAAGGRRDPTQVRVGDLGEARNDLLLRQVRKKMRRDFGVSPGATRGRMNFGVRCVWSGERAVVPWADGSCRATAEPGSNLTLDCEGGVGTAVFV